MKKFTRVIVLGVIMALFLACLAACNKNDDPVTVIKQVKPEVSYGYTAIGRYDITIDLNSYNYKKMALELVDNQEENTFAYGVQVVGDYVYYFYQYNSRGSIKKYNDYSGEKVVDGPLTVNEKTFYIGLFRVNINTAKCELVYEFTQVYPTTVSETERVYLGEIIDENRMVVQYNGTIKVLDLKEKKITDSVEVFNKETYVTANYFPYYFNEYGDYVVHKGNVMQYYELDGYSFKKHEYTFDTDTLGLIRLQNYIYIYDYVSLVPYYFDLRDDSAVGIDSVIVDWENEGQQPEEGAYFIGGKKYYLNFIADKYLEVFDENQNKLCQIDEAFMMENSKTFNDMKDLWTSEHRSYKAVNFWVENNKLLVGFNAECISGGRTPTYIYEYDVEANKLYYVGYSMSDIGVVLKLHKK